MTLFSPEVVKHASIMRILGGLLIMFSLAELFIGSIVFSWLSNVHLGAWWAAICSLIAGVLGALSINRYFVIVGFGFAAFGILLGIVGSVVEGISAAVFSGETGCINTETYKGYGSTEGKVDASICAGFNGNYEASAASRSMRDSGMKTQHYNFNYNIPYDNNNNFYYNHPRFIYYYFNTPHYHYDLNSTYYENHNYFNNYDYSSQNNNYYYNHPYFFDYYYNHLDTEYSTDNDGGNETNYNYNYNDNNNNNDNDNAVYYASLFGRSHQCICSDSKFCYGYSLTSGDDCGSVLTTYSPLLTTSTALCVAITILCFAYWVFTCIAGCSGSADGDTRAATTASNFAAEIELPSTSSKPGSPVAANLTAISQIEIQQKQRYSFHFPAAPGLYGMAPQDAQAVIGVYDDRTTRF